MDELDISGKRFISSKRAAKENRYHVDYIGQLIRSGKVIGSKVGRTWYVEAESLATYLGREYKAPTNTVQAIEHTPLASASATVREPSPVTEPVEPFKKEIETPVKVSVAEKTYAYTPSEQKVDFNHEIKKPTVGLTYLTDDEPFVAIPHTQPATLTTQMPSPMRQKSSPKVHRAPRTESHVSKKVYMATLAIVGIIAFGAAAGASYLLSYTSTVSGDANTASVTLGTGL